MNCLIHCLIASAFLVASVYMNFVKNDEYLNNLNEKQKEQYNKVKEERKKIYINSSLYAVIACLLVFMLFERGNNVMDACFYAFLFFMVQYFVYTLTPKKYWMLDVVEDNEDAKQWLDKYKYMKNNWHYGLLMGVLAFGLYVYFVLNNWSGDYNIIVIKPPSNDMTSELNLTNTPLKSNNVFTL